MDASGLRQRKARASARYTAADPADATVPLHDDDPKVHLRDSPTSTALWTPTDSALSAALLALAVLTRFVRLNHPSAIVYDEVHFGKWANDVLAGRFFFDLYPPLAKIVIAAGAALAGYTKDCWHFEPFGAEFPDECGPLGVAALRVAPAFFSALSVPTMYAALRFVGLSSVAALLGGVFVLFDVLAIAMARVGMADAILVGFSHVALAAGFLCFRLISDGKQHHRRGGALLPRVALAVSAAASGAALASKWTAIATPLLLASIAFFGIPPFLPGEPLPLPDVLLYAGGVLAAYTGSFLLFFANARSSGRGADAFMSRAFQMTLAGNEFHPDAVAAARDAAAAAADAAGTYFPDNTPSPSPTPSPLPVWGAVREIHRHMVSYNRGVRGNSTLQASWFQWPLNVRGSLVYLQHHAGAGADAAAGAEATADPMQSRIFLIMNPFTALAMLAATLVLIALVLILIRYRDDMSARARTDLLPKVVSAFWFQVTWGLAMLPTLVIYRAGPMYQYMPAMMYAQMVCATLVDMVPGPRARAAVVGVVSAGAVAAFAYWAPWAYAVPLTYPAQSARAWFKGWVVN